MSKNSRNSQSPSYNPAPKPSGFLKKMSVCFQRVLESFRGLESKGRRPTNLLLRSSSGGKNAFKPPRGGSRSISTQNRIDLLSTKSCNDSGGPNFAPNPQANRRSTSPVQNSHPCRDLCFFSFKSSAKQLTFWKFGRKHALESLNPFRFGHCKPAIKHAAQRAQWLSATAQTAQIWSEQE